MPPPMRRSRSDRKRTEIEQISQQSAGETWMSGRIRVYPGEVRVEIKFPVTFSEKPLPIVGGGEAVGTAQSAFFPSAQGMVVDWRVVNGRYVGADIAVKATGYPDQEVWLSFIFVGVALTNASTVE